MSTLKLLVSYKAGVGKKGSIMLKLDLQFIKLNENSIKVMEFRPLDFS